MRRHAAPVLSAAVTFALLSLIALSSATPRPIPEVDLAESARAADEMAAAAAAFLAALTPEQRAQAAFEFKADERANWHYVPKDRRGIPFKELTPAQRHLAHGLLRSVMSQRGYLKAVTIMSLEQIIIDLDMNPKWDPERYYFTVFGTPAPGSTWGWRVEGRHLSLNGTIVGGKRFAATPSFLGALPVTVPAGPRKGLRTLGDEEDLGRRLVKALSDDQRAAAVLPGAPPRDVITGAKRRVAPLSPAGLATGKMTAPQREMLLELVKEYVARHRAEVAAQDLERIERAGFEKVHFAWMGGLEPGQGHYYRLQGPTFLVEYDNTQNNANHIHSVWRDFANDFGEDLLRAHYECDHPK